MTACANCGSLFEAYRPTHKACSEACQQVLRRSTEGFKTGQRRRNAASRAKRVRMVDEMKTRPCTDCGLVAPAIMQLDHVPERGPKKFPVTPGRYVGVKAFAAELAKCDPVCPNCHAWRGVKRGTNRRRQ